MADVNLISQEAMNNVISKVEAVQMAVWDKTQEIGSRAEILLAQHRRTGESEILTEFGDTDGHVVLKDPAAISIEFGHFIHSPDGSVTYVPGLYILTNAAGL